MANRAPAHDSSSSVPCSVCFEDLSDSCGRTVVRLQCAHLFHLDCIGSAFNASGSMKCPYCREVENGTWRRFERTIYEDAEDQDTDDENADGEGSHVPSEMQPSNNRLHLVDHALFLILLKYDEMVQRELILARNCNFNHYMTGSLECSEITVTGSLECGEITASPCLPHPCRRNCPCMLNFPCILNTDANFIVPLPVPSLNPSLDPVSIPHLESIAHQPSLDLQLNIGSNTIGNNGSIYGNFRSAYQSSNSPSPAVYNMLAGRSAINGLQGWSSAGNAFPHSQQTGRFDHRSPLGGSLQSHPQPEIFHQVYDQDGNNVARPEYLHHHIYPFCWQQGD